MKMPTLSRTARLLTVIAACAIFFFVEIASMSRHPHESPG
jgi:hypothetical protein